MIRSLRVDERLSNRCIKTLILREEPALLTQVLLACDIVIKSTMAHFQHLTLHRYRPSLLRLGDKGIPPFHLPTPTANIEVTIWSLDNAV
jgi:hypothetical protein